MSDAVARLNTALEGRYRIEPELGQRDPEVGDERPALAQQDVGRRTRSKAA